MAKTDRDIYRGTHKTEWTEKFDNEFFHGPVPSWRRKIVRKTDRSARRKAMQRGDYESAVAVDFRQVSRVKNCYIINQ